MKFIKYKGAIEWSNQLCVKVIKWFNRLKSVWMNNSTSNVQLNAAVFDANPDCVVQHFKWSNIPCSAKTHSTISLPSKQYFIIFHSLHNLCRARARARVHDEITTNPRFERAHHIACSMLIAPALDSCGIHHIICGVSIYYLVQNVIVNSAIAHLSIWRQLVAGLVLHRNQIADGFQFEMWKSCQCEIALNVSSTEVSSLFLSLSNRNRSHVCI